MLFRLFCCSRINNFYSDMYFYLHWHNKAICFLKLVNLLNFNQIWISLFIVCIEKDLATDTSHYRHIHVILKSTVGTMSTYYVFNNVLLRCGLLKVLKKYSFKNYAYKTQTYRGSVFPLHLTLAELPNRHGLPFTKKR